MLPVELANKIVNEVKKLIDEDIIVVNTEGIIIASTDQERIGSFHEGALISSHTKEKFIITEHDVLTLQGVKAGINLPLLLNKEVIGIIGITGSPEKVSPFGEIVRKMTELLVQESYYSDQLEWQARTLEAFVFDWIQLNEWDDSFIDRAKLLKVDLNVNRQIAIASITSNPSSNRDLWRALKSISRLHENDIIIRWGNDRVVLILAVSDKVDRLYTLQKLKHFQASFQTNIKVPIVIGVGQTSSSQSLRSSFLQAERALKTHKIDNEIIFDEDLSIEMIIDELRSDTKIDFINRTIQPILHDEDSLSTLRALFQHGQSLKQTAEFLHIHINTLHYRLKKINQITGLNTNDFPDLVKIFLALQFLDNPTKT